MQGTFLAMRSLVTAEFLFWLSALVLLAIANPDAPPVLELCVWKWLGFSSCPGCGMGHALAYLLDGQFVAGINTHPLVPFAFVAIAGRLKASMPKRTTVPWRTIGSSYEPSS